jgi:DivIVA domain-containing protein
MAEDRTIAISSSNHLGPDEIARHTFGTSRRGFDPNEVRTFLEEVARELSSAQERERLLEKDIAEAEHRAAHPVLDEETLTTALGQETAQVLRAAHDAASNLLKRAEARASELITSAERRESQARSDAERASAEQAASLQAERDQVRRQSEQEAAARLESARRDSEELIEQSRSECRSMIEQAKELRTKILTDLSNRRRVLHLQIEQLQAGRERLSEAVQGVRVSVDTITNDLLRAEDEAQLAAEAAGRTAAAKPDLGFEEPDLSVSPALEASLAEMPRTAAGESSANAAAPGSSESTVDAPEAPEAEVAQQGSPTDAAAIPEASVEPVTDEPTADVSSEDETPVSPIREKQVDDLFARLRANGAGDAGAGGGSHSENGGHTNQGASDTDEIAQIVEITVESEDEATLELQRPFELVRKDELLSPVIAGLARRVKRALQDDQNDILDRIRSLGGWKDGVLPDVSEHTGRYVTASTEMLTEAARAGTTFAGVAIELAGDVDEEAAKLADTVVTTLRRRLEDDGPGVDPTDDAALAEHVGAAFREWRGDRTERLAGDHATAAFAQAALAATDRDVTIRWIVDDEGAPCADCEDNALAEDVRPGDPFPTGHFHPPAHSGCRCLLVVPVAT